MALFQKNGVQLNTAILDLSKSSDANSLCNFEETNQSLLVFGKGGTTICNHAPGVPLNILEAMHGAFYLLQSISSIKLTLLFFRSWYL